MKLDLLATIAVTASAAIAIAAMAIGFGHDLAARLRIASGLATWFIAVATLAALEVFHYPRALAVPGLGLAVVLPIVVLSLSVLRSPALRRALGAVPLSLLVGVNVIRTFGVIFLLLYAAGRLPAPFAPVAGWGDIIVGVAAVPVAWLVSRWGARAHPVVLVWTALGLADLIAAVGLGVTSSPGPLQLIAAEPGADIMTTLPWLLVPAFLVPLLASTHLAVFYRLLRDAPESGKGV